MFNNSFSEPCAVFEIMSNNILHPDLPQMTVLCMCVVYWPRKDTNTTEYVIIIYFRMQNSLLEHTSMLLYTIIVCLSLLYVVRRGVYIKIKSLFH